MLIECDNCKKEFDKKVSKIKLSKKHFCSIKCRNDFSKIKINCQCCKKDLEIYKYIFEKSKSKHFFCNRSCSAIFNNIKRKNIKKCLYCGKECDNKYCSISCHAADKHKKNYNSYENGQYDVFKTNRTLKKYLIDKNGYKCNLCGISNWNEKLITLELEHKDGNYRNNSPENVELLCPNCHSQTPTFKGKNKGNGRHKRRERYKDGKSY